MKIEKYIDENYDFESAISSGEIFLALISFDCTRAIIGRADDCMEHHILLAKMNLPSLDIDKYFRIVFDQNSADWTFVCPPEYQNIGDKQERIKRFYVDGHTAISNFLSEIGLCADIKIPQRYKRHFKEMSN